MKSFRANQYYNLRYNLNTQNKVDSLNGVLKKILVENRIIYENTITDRGNVNFESQVKNGLSFSFSFYKLSGIEVKQQDIVMNVACKSSCQMVYKTIKIDGVEEEKKKEVQFDALVADPDFSPAIPNDASATYYNTWEENGMIYNYIPNTPAQNFLQSIVGKLWIQFREMGRRSYKFDLTYIDSASAAALPAGSHPSGSKYKSVRASVEKDTYKLTNTADVMYGEDIPFNVTIGAAVGRNQKMEVIDYDDLAEAERKLLSAPFTMPSNEFITTLTVINAESWIAHMAKRIIGRRWRGLYTVSADIPIVKIEDRLSLNEQIKFYDVFGQPIKRFGTEVVFEVMKIEYRYEGGGLVQRIEGLEVGGD